MLRKTRPRTLSAAAPSAQPLCFTEIQPFVWSLSSWLSHDKRHVGVYPAPRNSNNRFPTTSAGEGSIPSVMRKELAKKRRSCCWTQIRSCGQELLVAPEMEGICVFILAENRLLREALSRFLSKKSDIRVVGASAFSTRIVEQIASLRPHVLLSDFAAFVSSAPTWVV